MAYDCCEGTLTPDPFLQLFDPEASVSDLDLVRSTDRQAALETAAPGRLCEDRLFPRAAERIRRTPHGNRRRAQGRLGPAVVAASAA